MAHPESKCDVECTGFSQRNGDRGDWHGKQFFVALHQRRCIQNAQILPSARTRLERASVVGGAGKTEGKGMLLASSMPFDTTSPAPIPPLETTLKLPFQEGRGLSHRFHSL